MTLSRQTGKRLQYFLAYTYGKGLGTTVANGEYDDVDAFDPRHRSYGVLGYDRTHILNFSYNYSVPDLTKHGGVLGGILNGWQISVITTWASGTPISLAFSGDIASSGVNNAWFGTPDHQPFRVTNSIGNGSTIEPIYTCDPRQSGSAVGDKILNVNCLQIPAFGQSGPFVPPIYIRLPSRANFDVTIFKNFRIGQGDKRKLQVRLGAFDLFNQATPNIGFQDIDLNLQTTCNVRVNGVPNGVGGTADNVCDPTKGFSYTQQTIDNFGKIIMKRGHRIVEVALKLYF